MEVLLGALAEAILSVVLSTIADTNAVRRLRAKIGSAPESIALKIALLSTYNRFSKEYPSFTESFFDDVFLQKQEVIEELAKLLSPHEMPNEKRIRQAWGKQFFHRPSEEEFIPVAHFIKLLENEIKLRPDLREFVNSRNLERIANQGSEQQVVVKDIRDLGSQLVELQKQAISPVDPYRTYLQKLLRRINHFLSEKIHAQSLKERELTIPLELRSEYEADAVDEAYAQEVLDPLYIIGGLENAENCESFDTFDEAFELFKGRLLLLGAPGAGKTTTLLSFARDAVTRRLQDISQPLPILGIIPTWRPESHDTLTKWLEKSHGTPNNIEELISTGNVLLLLDGLDELGERATVQRTVRKEDGQSVETTLRIDPRAEFTELIPDNNQIVITCRHQDYQDMGVKLKVRGAVTLKPLTHTQIQQYLRGLPNVQNLIDNDEQLRNLAETPLLLSIMSLAFAKSGNEYIEDIDLDDSELRTRIFEFYVKERYEHENRKLNHNISISLTEFYDEMGRIAFEDMLDSWIEEGESYGDFIIELAQQLKLLTSGTVTERLRFSHLLFRDFFALKYAVKLLSDSRNFALHRQRYIEAAAAMIELFEPRHVHMLRAALIHMIAEGDEKDVHAVISSLAVSLIGLDDREAIYLLSDYYPLFHFTLAHRYLSSLATLNTELAARIAYEIFLADPGLYSELEDFPSLSRIIDQHIRTDICQVPEHIVHFIWYTDTAIAERAFLEILRSKNRDHIDCAEYALTGIYNSQAQYAREIFAAALSNIPTKLHDLYLDALWDDALWDDDDDETWSIPTTDES